MALEFTMLKQKIRIFFLTRKMLKAHRRLIQALRKMQGYDPPFSYQ